LQPLDEDDADDSTAQIILPSEELTLAAHDDAAEFDDMGDVSVFKDDPSVVAFRKSNKLGVYVKVRPTVSQGEVVVMFRIKYDYVNTMLQATGEQKEPQIVWMNNKLWVSVGTVGEVSAAGDWHGAGK